MATCEEQTSSAYQKLDKVSCTICLELFRSPRLLPCHHTFCLPCLKDLACSHDGKAFPCPSCRKQAVVPPGGVDEFQVNFYLEDDLAAAKHATAVQRSPQQPAAPASTPQSSRQDQGQVRQRRTVAIQHESQNTSDKLEREIQRLKHELEQSRAARRKDKDKAKQEISDKIKHMQRIFDSQKQCDDQRIRKLVADVQQQTQVIAGLRKEKKELRESIRQKENTIKIQAEGQAQGFGHSVRNLERRGDYEERCMPRDVARRRGNDDRYMRRKPTFELYLHQWDINEFMNLMDELENVPPVVFTPCALQCPYISRVHVNQLRRRQHEHRQTTEGMADNAKNVLIVVLCTCIFFLLLKLAT